jgi:nitrate reductase beta subunit
VSGPAPTKRACTTRTPGPREKCVGCYPAVEQGIQPQCVVNCIGKIRIMGFINPPWQARDDNPSGLTWSTKKVLRCHIIHSNWAWSPTSTTSRPCTPPRDYLHQMFGPAGGRLRWTATAALASRTRWPRGCMVLMGSTDRIIHRFDVKDGVARGFDEAGALLVSVPVTEPLYERAAWDSSLGVVRNNTP